MVIISQIQGFPLLLKIHKEEGRLTENLTKTHHKEGKSCFKRIKIKIQNFVKRISRDELTNNDEEIIKHIEDVLAKPYERPTILKLYDELIPLTEDKLFEGFMESAPQMILQLKIVLGSNCQWGTKFILSIIVSFINLAVTVTDYSMKFRQKNPALRQASLAGHFLLVISKTPFLLSRTFAISIIFTLPKNGVFYGFSYMVFETIIFSYYEYSQMTSEGISETVRKGNVLRFLMKLFTRGYISNYILLEDCLIKYDGKKWIYQSDEPYKVKTDEKQHRHQLIYLVIMSSINFTIGCELYSYEPSEFNLTPSMHAFIALSIMFGGVSSLLFTILYQSTKNSSMMSELGPCLLYTSPSPRDRG